MVPALTRLGETDLERPSRIRFLFADASERRPYRQTVLRLYEAG
jgi:hypothetical protein